VRGAAALAAVLLLAPGGARAGGYAPHVNYALHCQGCHLADGRATPGLVPPLDATLGRLAGVPDGRAYLVRLPNVVAAQIDDESTAALMTWVVRRFGGAALPRSFPPYTAAEIAAARRAPLVDLEAERRRVLALLGEGGS
jgi:hypothetical protein